MGPAIFYEKLIKINKIIAFTSLQEIFSPRAVRLSTAWSKKFLVPRNYNNFLNFKLVLLTIN